MSNNRTDRHRFHSIQRKPETMHFRSLATGNKNNWNEDDTRFILKNHKTMYLEDMAEELGRTVGATRNKAFRMGCGIQSKPKGKT